MSGVCESEHGNTEACATVKKSTTTTAAGSVSPRKHKLRRVLRKFFRYCGPGYMIAVGYMDPGNWATDIEAGSSYGYSLLFIILLSNLMAMVLQHLCVRLGVTTRMDLAQACRARMPRWANIPMYIIAEVAIISCDLAEVIGTAIALKLLFGIPILFGVLLTICDVLLLLAGLGRQSEERAYKALEVIVIFLMTIIGICFITVIFLVKPVWSQVAYGFLPFSAAKLMFDPKALFSALGIIGATVMPHNLYLHSSIVQHRLRESDDLEEAKADEEGSPTALSTIINYATADSTIALIFAMFVNAAILIVGSAAFHSRGKTNVQYIEDASHLMGELLGPATAILFGCALLAAGQSSTVTGTMAGQIVFEGHLQLRMKPWLRRLVTRVVAIAPAILIIVMVGAESINELLIYSQVILSFQLPFAIIPLTVFAFIPLPGTENDPALCKYWEGRRKSRWEPFLKIASCLIAAILVVLNILSIVTWWILSRK
jgi:manganese transport protein